MTPTGAVTGARHTVTTGKAALLEGFRFVGAELNEEYAEIARARIGAPCQS